MKENELLLENKKSQNEIKKIRSKKEAKKTEILNKDLFDKSQKDLIEKKVIIVYILAKT